jgi:hypothetical protein
VNSEELRAKETEPYNKTTISKWKRQKSESG